MANQDDSNKKPTQRQRADSISEQMQSIFTGSTLPGARTRSLSTTVRDRSSFISLAVSSNLNVSKSVTDINKIKNAPSALELRRKYSVELKIRQQEEAARKAAALKAKQSKPRDRTFSIQSVESVSDQTRVAVGGPDSNQSSPTASSIDSASAQEQIDQQSFLLRRRLDSESLGQEAELTEPSSDVAPHSDFSLQRDFQNLADFPSFGRPDQSLSAPQHYSPTPVPRKSLRRRILHSAKSSQVLSTSNEVPEGTLLEFGVLPTFPSSFVVTSVLMEHSKLIANEFAEPMAAQVIFDACADSQNAQGDQNPQISQVAHGIAPVVQAAPHTSACNDVQSAFAARGTSPVLSQHGSSTGEENDRFDVSLPRLAQFEGNIVESKRSTAIPGDIKQRIPLLSKAPVAKSPPVILEGFNQGLVTPSKVVLSSSSSDYVTPPSETLQPRSTDVTIQQDFNSSSVAVQTDGGSQSNPTDNVEKVITDLSSPNAEVVGFNGNEGLLYAHTKISPVEQSQNQDDAAFIDNQNEQNLASLATGPAQVDQLNVPLSDSVQKDSDSSQNNKKRKLSFDAQDFIPQVVVSVPKGAELMTAVASFAQSQVVEAISSNSLLNVPEKSGTKTSSPDSSSRSGSADTVINAASVQSNSPAQREHVSMQDSSDALPPFHLSRMHWGYFTAAADREAAVKAETSHFRKLFSRPMTEKEEIAWLEYLNEVLPQVEDKNPAQPKRGVRSNDCRVVYPVLCLRYFSFLSRQEKEHAVALELYAFRLRFHQPLSSVVVEKYVSNLIQSLPGFMGQSDQNQIDADSLASVLYSSVNLVPIIPRAKLQKQLNDLLPILTDAMEHESEVDDDRQSSSDEGGEIWQPPALPPFELTHFYWQLFPTELDREAAIGFENHHYRQKCPREPPSDELNSWHRFLDQVLPVSLCSTRPVPGWNLFKHDWHESIVNPVTCFQHKEFGSKAEKEYVIAVELYSFRLRFKGDLNIGSIFEYVERLNNKLPSFSGQSNTNRIDPQSLARLLRASVNMVPLVPLQVLQNKLDAPLPLLTDETETEKEKTSQLNASGSRLHVDDRLFPRTQFAASKSRYNFYHQSVGLTKPLDTVQEAIDSVTAAVCTDKSQSQVSTTSNHQDDVQATEQPGNNLVAESKSNNPSRSPTVGELFDLTLLDEPQDGTSTSPAIPLPPFRLSKFYDDYFTVQAWREEAVYKELDEFQKRCCRQLTEPEMQAFVDYARKVLPVVTWGPMPLLSQWSVQNPVHDPAVMQPLKYKYYSKQFADVDLRDQAIWQEMVSFKLRYHTVFTVETVLQLRNSLHAQMPKVRGWKDRPQMSWVEFYNSTPTINDVEKSKRMTTLLNRYSHLIKGPPRPLRTPGANVSPPETPTVSLQRVEQQTEVLSAIKLSVETLQKISAIKKPSAQNCDWGLILKADLSTKYPPFDSESDLVQAINREIHHLMNRFNNDRRFNPALEKRLKETLRMRLPPVVESIDESGNKVPTFKSASASENQVAAANADADSDDEFVNFYTMAKYPPDRVCESEYERGQLKSREKQQFLDVLGRDWRSTREEARYDAFLERNLPPVKTRDQGDAVAATASAQSSMPRADAARKHIESICNQFPTIPTGAAVALGKLEILVEQGKTKPKVVLSLSSENTQNVSNVTTESVVVTHAQSSVSVAPILSTVISDSASQPIASLANSSNFDVVQKSDDKKLDDAGVFENINNMLDQVVDEGAPSTDYLTHFQQPETSSIATTSVVSAAVTTTAVSVASATPIITAAVSTAPSLAPLDYQFSFQSQWPYCIVNTTTTTTTSACSSNKTFVRMVFPGEVSTPTIFDRRVLVPPHGAQDAPKATVGPNGEVDLPTEWPEPRTVHEQYSITVDLPSVYVMDDFTRAYYEEHFKQRDDVRTNARLGQTVFQQWQHLQSLLPTSKRYSNRFPPLINSEDWDVEYNRERAWDFPLEGLEEQELFHRFLDQEACDLYEQDLDMAYAEFCKLSDAQKQDLIDDVPTPAQRETLAQSVAEEQASNFAANPPQASSTFLADKTRSRRNLAASSNLDQSAVQGSFVAPQATARASLSAANSASNINASAPAAKASPGVRFDMSNLGHAMSQPNLSAPPVNATTSSANASASGTQAPPSDSQNTNSQSQNSDASGGSGTHSKQHFHSRTSNPKPTGASFGGTSGFGGRKTYSGWGGPRVTRPDQAKPQGNWSSTFGQGAGNQQQQSQQQQSQQQVPPFNYQMPFAGGYAYGPWGPYFPSGFGAPNAGFNPYFNFSGAPNQSAQQQAPSQQQQQSNASDDASRRRHSFSSRSQSTRRNADADDSDSADSDANSSLYRFNKEDHRIMQMVPQFSKNMPTRTLESFLKEFLRYAKLARLSEAGKLFYLGDRLTGEAKEKYLELPDVERSTWISAREALERYYKSDQTESHWRAAFRKRERDDNGRESTREWSKAIHSLYLKAYPEWISGEGRDDTLIEKFLTGIDLTMRKRLLEENLRSFDAYSKRAIYLDQQHEIALSFDTSKKSRDVNTGNNSDSHKNDSDANRNDSRGNRDGRNGRFDRRSNDNQNRGNNFQNQQFNKSGNLEQQQQSAQVVAPAASAVQPTVQFVPYPFPTGSLPAFPPPQASGLPQFNFAPSLAPVAAPAPQPLQTFHPNAGQGQGNQNPFYKPKNFRKSLLNRVVPNSYNSKPRNSLFCAVCNRTTNHSTERCWFRQNHVQSDAPRLPSRDDSVEADVDQEKV